MRLMRTVFVSSGVLSCLAAAGLLTPVFADHQEEEEAIEQILSAASTELAKGGTVLDRQGDLLEEGDRMTPPAHLQETPPMCNGGVWMEWSEAYVHMKHYAGGTRGVCYMLASNDGASNIGPYSEGPTDDSQWIKEGAHLVVLVSDSAQL